MRYITILVTILLLTTGCSSATPTEKQNTGDEAYINVHVIGSPTVEEILSKYKETDIFLMNAVVYVNAEEVDWVKELDLTLGDEVLEITSLSDHREDFTNGTASILPIGTKIYQTIEKGDIYIAVVDDKEIRYLGWREG